MDYLNVLGNPLSVAEKMMMLRSMFLHLIHFPLVLYFSKLMDHLYSKFSFVDYVIVFRIVISVQNYFVE